MFVPIRLETLYNLEFMVDHFLFSAAVGHIQSSTDLEQTRVSVEEMRPGEQHRSSALARAHIEHSLGRAANIARRTEA